MSAAVTSALDACRTRGIVVEQWAGDEHGNVWRAAVRYRGRAAGQPGWVHLLAPTEDEAARMALRYVGARGWR